METSIAKLETINFHTDKLFCPVINNEPMIVMNIIIRNIGLNYATAMNDFLKSRFSKWFGNLKMIKTENGKFNIVYGISNSEKEQKNEHNLSFDMPNGILNSDGQQTQWNQLFSKIGGYEYVVLPIRKLAGWLYSINPNKVKPEIKAKLELYQDECDEILYQHFFGPISSRKKLLIEKSEISNLISEHEKDLMNNPLYVEYVNLKAEEMRLGKSLKALDCMIVSNQKSLFDAQKN